MDVQDLILLAVGAAVGYYFVSHMKKTGKAY
jgi:hypothetical protein